MKILCVLSRHAYGDPSRGENYDHAHFVPAWKALGHTVEVFDSGDRTTYADFAELNAALLRKVTSFQPDVIFTVLMLYEVWLETLDLIRAHTPARIVNWGTDDSWKFMQATRYFAKHVDLHVTTDAGTPARASALGLDNVMLSQWAASALNAPLPSAACKYDVSFVGNLYGDRKGWIAALRAAGIDVKCFGHGSEHGVVASDEIPEIYRGSRISLNFTGAGDGVPLLRAASDGQIKARTFEVPGAGGFLLTQHAEGLERYFRIGEEIAVFRSADDLVRLVRFYLGHPEARDRVANAGHRRTAEHHIYTSRFAEILARVPKASGSGGRSSGVADLAPALRRHRVGASARFMRCAVAAPLGVLFGPSRGPRAARRLAFELSWRLAGEGTYRAAGWPGRLFFRET